MKEHQHLGSVAAGNDGPFPRHAIAVDWRKLDVIGDRTNGANLIQALAPGLPAHGPRLGTQESADGVDPVRIHDHSSRPGIDTPDFSGSLAKVITLSIELHFPTPMKEISSAGDQ
jgi:hypothetical protein